MRLARWTTLPVISLTLGAAPLAAQGLGLGASVGTNVPSGSFGDQAKSGLVVNGIVELRLPALVGLRGELFYSRSDIENAIIRKVGDATLPSNSNVTGDVNLIGGIGNVVVNIGSAAVHPYIIGGVGIYHRRVAQDFEGTASEFRHLTDSESKVGYNGGAGIALSLVGIHAFVEARYHSVGTTPDRTNFIPVTVGITF
jgi:hypothetical protein